MNELLKDWLRYGENRSFTIRWDNSSVCWHLCLQKDDNVLELRIDDREVQLSYVDVLDDHITSMVREFKSD